MSCPTTRGRRGCRGAGSLRPPLPGNEVLSSQWRVEIVCHVDLTGKAAWSARGGGGNRAEHRFRGAGLGDDDCLARGGAVEQPRQVSLGIVDVDSGFGHADGKLINRTKSNGFTESGVGRHLGGATVFCNILIIGVHSCRLRFPLFVGGPIGVSVVPGCGERRTPRGGGVGGGLTVCMATDCV